MIKGIPNSSALLDVVSCLAESVSCFSGFYRQLLPPHEWKLSRNAALLLIRAETVVSEWHSLTPAFVYLAYNGSFGQLLAGK